jgi:hypothetical protein
MQRPLHHYSVLGLSLSSSIAIPGLFEVDAPGPVAYEIRFGRVEHPGIGPEYGSVVRHGEGSTSIRFADRTIAEIDVRQRVITVDAIAGATLEDTATYITGPIAGLVARIEGQFCLHAAVVAVDGESVVLVGSSESGKSTTAAACMREGLSLLSDDVCAVDEEGGSLVVRPSSPRIRLWDDGAVMALGGGHDLPALTPTWNKLYVDLVAEERYQTRSLPIGAIWIFSASSDRVELLRGSSCLTALLSNVYLPQHGTPEMKRRDLAAAAKLCERVPVRLLPARLAPAERVRTILEHHRTRGDLRIL